LMETQSRPTKKKSACEGNSIAPKGEGTHLGQVLWGGAPFEWPNETKGSHEENFVQRGYPSAPNIAFSTGEAKGEKLTKRRVEPPTPPGFRKNSKRRKKGEKRGGGAKGELSYNSHTKRRDLYL